MSFNFTNLAYKFWSKWTPAKIKAGTEILKSAIEEGWTTRFTEETLKANDLGYATADMAHDISMARATEMSKTDKSYESSSKFWNTVERARKDLHLATRRDAIEFMHRWGDESMDTLEEIEEAEMLEDEGFEPSPKGE